MTGHEPVHHRGHETDRRTYIRNAVTVGGIPVIGSLGGCLADLPANDQTPTDDDGGSEPASPDLQTGTTIGMVFTAFGGQTSRSDVYPDEPGGGRLLTVVSLDPGKEVTIRWRETVERKVTPSETQDGGVGTPTPTPETEIVERTGDLTATGLAEVHEPLLPMSWETGSETTPTSAMWLSQEAYRELRDTRQTAWSRDVLTRISWVGKEVQERIHEGVEEVDEVYLEAESNFVEFDLSVDGQRTSVQAIKAHDSFGNEYIILATESNPLVLKFTYDAISVGFSGFDTALWSVIKAVFSGYQVLTLGGV